MNIYDLPQENDYISLKIFIWLLYNSQHLIIFWSLHLFLRSMPEIFYQFNEQAFGFLGIIHFQYKSLSLFPSQILVCATTFTAHYLFSFWDLQLLSSISKNNKMKNKFIFVNVNNKFTFVNFILRFTSIWSLFFLTWEVLLPL